MTNPQDPAALAREVLNYPALPEKVKLARAVIALTEERDALKALLAECEGYVGIAMRASPDTGDIVRLLSRIDAALRGKEGS